MIHRRSFITGLISLVAAPAIVRAGSLMPVKGERLLTLSELDRLRDAFIRHAEQQVRPVWMIALPQASWRMLNESVLRDVG